MCPIWAQYYLGDLNLKVIVELVTALFLISVIYPAFWVWDPSLHVLGHFACLQLP